MDISQKTQQFVRKPCHPWTTEQDFAPVVCAPDRPSLPIRPGWRTGRVNARRRRGPGQGSGDGPRGEARGADGFCHIITQPLRPGSCGADSQRGRAFPTDCEGGVNLSIGRKTCKCQITQRLVRARRLGVDRSSPCRTEAQPGWPAASGDRRRPTAGPVAREAGWRPAAAVAPACSREGPEHTARQAVTQPVGWSRPHGHSQHGGGSNSTARLKHQGQEGVRVEGLGARLGQPRDRRPGEGGRGRGALDRGFFSRA